MGSGRARSPSEAASHRPLFLTRTLWPSAQGLLAALLCGLSQKRALVRTEDGTGTPRAQLSGPWGRGHGLVMVVTQLNLEFRFQGGKLRGFSCELTRSPHGVFPETFITITGQIVVPVLLSGLGMVTAGLVMNAVQVRTGPRGWQPAPGSLVLRSQGPQRLRLSDAPAVSLHEQSAWELTTFPSGRHRFTGQGLDR